MSENKDRNPLPPEGQTDSKEQSEDDRETKLSATVQAEQTGKETDTQPTLAVDEKPQERELEDQKKSAFSSAMISEPDEAGIRYYRVGSNDSRRQCSYSQTQNAGGGSAPYHQYQAGQGGPDVRSGHAVRGKRFFRKPLLIFAGILAAFVLLGVACNAVWPEGNGEYADIADEHIGILYLEGTISSAETGSFGESESYNQEWIMESLDDVIHNENNKGLILYVDSPGGEVYATDQVYRKLLQYKATGRPLYTYMGSMAASGGYYVAAPSDRIIADRNCWTGSIGVVMGTYYDISELLDKYGIRATNFVSGENKDMGSAAKPFTEEQKEIMQSLVDESYEQFVGIVADGRKLPVKRVKQLADGRIYTAKQAKKVRLIDEIGTLDDAVTQMRQNFGLYDCTTHHMQYEENDFWSSLWSVFGGKKMQSENGELTALTELMEQQGKMPICYLSEIRK